MNQPPPPYGNQPPQGWPSPGTPPPGTPPSGQEPMYQCPRCGQLNPSSAPVCARCGLQFATYGAPPPPENHATRNAALIIGAILLGALLLALAILAMQGRGGPSPSLPPPSAEASAEPSAEPTAERTDEATAEPTPEVTEQPTAEVTEQPTVEPSAEPSPEQPTAEPTSEQPTAEPTPTGSPTGDQGLVIGTPVVLDDGVVFQLGVLVQNVSDQVLTYTLTATFKNGDTITATGSGIMNDHVPGSTRAALLFIDGTPGPSDTIDVSVDTILGEAPSTPGSEIAAQISFGPPSIMPGDFPTVAAEVTNNSPSAVTITVSGAITRANQLVGVVTGIVNDIGAGQTKTATLFVVGGAEQTDEVVLSVDAVISGP